MRLRESHSQAAFVLANIAAGFLHYIFQIRASQHLSGEAFAELNRWFADLALFFSIGGVLQYVANFFPKPRNELTLSLILINAVALALIYPWRSGSWTSPGLLAVTIIFGAAAFGWISGQLQNRTLFLGMAAANLIVAVTKLSVLFVLPDNALETYRFALYVCYIPGLWVLSRWIFSSKSVEPALFPPSSHLWLAPVILSVATAVIPQMDLVLVGQIQASSVDVEFTRASLFYKGIYFLIFIFAQLLLPHQIAGRWNFLKPGRFLALAFGLSLIASAALTGVAPWVVQWLLHWENAPSGLLIFLSCVNMSLLAWLLILMQEACARARSRQAGLVLLVLGIEALAQLIWRGSLPGYFALAIGIQAILVITLARSVRRPT